MICEDTCDKLERGSRCPVFSRAAKWSNGEESPNIRSRNFKTYFEFGKLNGEAVHHNLLSEQKFIGSKKNGMKIYLIHDEHFTGIDEISHHAANMGNYRRKLYKSLAE